MNQVGKTICEIGDWVRFMRNNEFVIGQVEYILNTNSAVPGTVVTTAGGVSPAGILERRPRNTGNQR